jgi:hypothetical protein
MWRTRLFVGCRPLSEGLRTILASGAVDRPVWQMSSMQPGGGAHVSTIPVYENARMLGYVGLIHDLSYIERHAWTTRLFLGVAFGILALAASGVTLVAAR